MNEKGVSCCVFHSVMIVTSFSDYMLPAAHRQCPVRDKPRNSPAATRVKPLVAREVKARDDAIIITPLQP